MHININHTLTTEPNNKPFNGLAINIALVYAINDDITIYD